MVQKDQVYITFKIIYDRVVYCARLAGYDRPAGRLQTLPRK